MLHINDFVKEVGENNKAHGFRDVNTRPTDFVALIHSEVSEVLEEFRAGHTATETYYREKRWKARRCSGRACRHCYQVL